MLAIELMLVAFTNHAGMAVSGVPIALTSKTAILSNAVEVQTVPLSIFPELEQRRLAAEYVSLHPERTELLRLPRDIRKAVDANASSIRRSQNRAAKGMCSKEQSEAFCKEAKSALSQYLDTQEKNGRILPAERRLLQE